MNFFQHVLRQHVRVPDSLMSVIRCGSRRCRFAALIARTRQSVCCQRCLVGRGGGDKGPSPWLVDRVVVAVVPLSCLATQLNCQQLRWGHHKTANYSNKKFETQGTSHITEFDLFYQRCPARRAIVGDEEAVTVVG
jgi:hypothetical protein